MTGSEIFKLVPKKTAFNVYKYAALNGDGEWNLFCQKPEYKAIEKNSDYKKWVTSSGSEGVSLCILFKDNKVNPENSLVERPKSFIQKHCVIL